MKDAVVAGRILMSKADGGGYYAVDCAGTDFTFSVIGRRNDEAVYGQAFADELAGPIVESLAHMNNADFFVLAAASQKFGRYTLAGNAGVIADLDDKVQLKVGDREFEYVVTGGALGQRSDVVGISVYELKQDNGAFVLDVTKDLTYVLTLNDGQVCEVARGFAGADATSFTVQVFSRDDLADAMTIESNVAACDIYSGRAWSGVRAHLIAGEASSDSMSFGNWHEYGQATKVESDGDGIGDVFLASSNLTWGNGHVAFHSVLGETLCAVTLDGKLRYEDTFAGSTDASVLCLTDDARGDALFLDDIFTILGDEARVTGIDEIRLGAGDDVLDLTSNRYFDASGKSMLIRGGDGNDVIYAGNIETTLINGGSGDDILVGGGVGNDVFLFADDFGSDRVYQFGEGGITLVFAENLVVPQSIVDGEDLVYEFSNNQSVRLVGWAGKDVTIGKPEDYAYGLAVDPGIRLQ
ncbi:MAG: hypothetical protein GX561_07720 [Lentisphaerae bacterium]|nr:hypothetical protein [Lentisphaerota bacterium]